MGDKDDEEGTRVMMSDSKAQNMFAVIRENQNRELSAALHRACSYITEKCDRCPLAKTDKCALAMLPDKLLRDNRVYICSEWISLHFRGGGR